MIAIDRGAILLALLAALPATAAVAQPKPPTPDQGSAVTAQIACQTLSGQIIDGAKLTTALVAASGPAPAYRKVSGTITPKLNFEIRLPQTWNGKLYYGGGGGYALRWKAEVFHKVMKSGCRAEEARLETAERLAKFLALMAMVSWRIFFITMSARAKPDAKPETVLTPAEIAALDSIDAARTKPRILRRTLAIYLLQIAMLGGYLARNHDPPPGTMVVWRGLTRLNDIAFGISVGTYRRCG